MKKKDMSCYCSKHQCLGKDECRHKAWLGPIPLCRLAAPDCPDFAPEVFGRYEPEDLLDDFLDEPRPK